MYRPCGVYHEKYQQDHAWWQSTFVKGKMLLLFLFFLVIYPLLGSYFATTFSQSGSPFLANLAGFIGYSFSVANLVGYTVLSAMGVQLLIGYCGQITLGHAAFIAVGAYTSAIGMLHYGLPYPLTVIMAAVTAGFWSVLFGLPSAKVKGFYLIMTTMAAQFITVEFIITQYVSQIGGRGVAFSLPPGTVQVGPWNLDSDVKIYYLMIVLVILCNLFLANLLRTKVGRAWIAIRDNDIAAETMGVNIVYYKLTAFFVAGALGGIAGSFWITTLSAVSPEHFQWSWSLWLVGVILIGGVGSMHGTIFGAMFITLVLEALKFAVIPLSGYYPQLQDKFLFIKEMVFGLSIALFLLFEPKGLAYRWWQIKNYFNLWPFSY